MRKPDGMPAGARSPDTGSPLLNPPKVQGRKRMERKLLRGNMSHRHALRVGTPRLQRRFVGSAWLASCWRTEWLSETAA